MLEDIIDFILEFILCIFLAILCGLSGIFCTWVIYKIVELIGWY